MILDNRSSAPDRCGEASRRLTKDRPSVDIIREYYTSDQVFILYSDYNNFDLLEKANIREASIVFINLDDDTESWSILLTSRNIQRPSNYVVTLDNGNLKSTFHHAGVTYASPRMKFLEVIGELYLMSPMWPSSAGAPRLRA